MLKNLHRLGLARSTRACTSTPNWETLLAEHQNYNPNENELFVFRLTRPWANADHIKVDTVRQDIQIRWSGIDERNLNISLDSNSANFYTKHVKAVFYGLIWSIHHRSRHVIVESSNDIVCKVSMGLYKAGKEARMFEGIKKLTLADDLDVDTFCKAKVICTALSKEPSSVSKTINKISEHEFRKAHSKDINWMLH